MNTYWIKVNRASNGYILTWPTPIDDAGHTVLEHQVVPEEPSSNGRAAGAKTVLERIIAFFGLDTDPHVKVRVVTENAEGEEVDLG